MTEKLQSNYNFIIQMTRNPAAVYEYMNRRHSTLTAPLKFVAVALHDRELDDLTFLLTFSFCREWPCGGFNIVMPSNFGGRDFSNKYLQNRTMTNLNVI